MDAMYCISSYRCKAPPPRKKTDGDDSREAAPAVVVETKCADLDPFVDSVPHPENDPACEAGFPGWRKDAACTCNYDVKVHFLAFKYC
jgi:hypothetical protein